MLFVDDFSVFRILDRLLTVHAAHRPGKFACKAVQHGFVDQNIVGSHAGLARVQQLAPCDPPRSQREIRRLVHDAGAFSAQLQRDGGEMLGGSLHHHTSNGGTSGEEDMVKFEREQFLVDGRSALENRDKTGGKGAAQHVLQHNGCFCGIAGGLDHSAVSGGECRGQRGESELYGIIPGREDQHHAERLRTDGAHAGELRQRAAHRLWPHPVFQVSPQLPDFLINHTKLRGVCFKGGFSQIFLQGGEQSGFIFLHCVGKAFQGGKPETGGKRHPGFKKAPLAAEGFFAVFHLFFLLFRRAFSAPSVFIVGERGTLCKKIFYER